MVTEWGIECLSVVVCLGIKLKNWSITSMGLSMCSNTDSNTDQSVEILPLPLSSKQCLKEAGV